MPAWAARGATYGMKRWLIPRKRTAANPIVAAARSVFISMGHPAGPAGRLRDPVSAPSRERFPRRAATCFNVVRQTTYLAIVLDGARWCGLLTAGFDLSVGSHHGPDQRRLGAGHRPRFSRGPRPRRSRWAIRARADRRDRSRRPSSARSTASASAPVSNVARRFMMTPRACCRWALGRGAHHQRRGADLRALPKVFQGGVSATAGLLEIPAPSVSTRRGLFRDSSSSSSTGPGWGAISTPSAATGGAAPAVGRQTPAKHLFLRLHHLRGAGVVRRAAADGGGRETGESDHRPSPWCCSRSPPCVIGGRVPLFRRHRPPSRNVILGAFFITLLTKRHET